MTIQPMRSCLLLLFLLSVSLPAVSQTAERYIAMSDSIYYTGNFEKALAYAAKAEKIIEKDSGKISHAYARLADQQMGWNYDKKGDVLQALKWMRTSVDIYRRINETHSFEYGEAMVNLGVLYNTLGAYNEAEKLCSSAQQLFKAIPDSGDGYAAAINGLATAYNYTGRYAEAELLYEEALNIAKRLRMEQSYQGASLYTNLGGFYSKTGRYEKALQALKKAAAFYQKSGKMFFRNYGINLLNTAATFEQMNQPDSTKKYIEQVLSLLQNNPDAFLLANALNATASMQMQKKNFAQAVVVYKQALSAAYNTDSSLGGMYNSIAINLAGAYFAAGNTLQADSLYKTGFKQLYALGNPDYRILNYLYQGYCAFLIAQKKFGEAADSLQSLGKQTLAFMRRNFAGMAEEEKLRFINTLYKNFDLQYALLALDKNASPAFVQHAFSNALLLKGLVLFNQSAAIRAVNGSKDAAVKASFAAWLLLKQLVANQYSLPRAQQTLNVDSLEAEAAAAEKVFSRYEAANENWFPYREMPLKNITQKLKPAEAAVEFVRFNYPVVRDKDSILYGAFVLNAGDTGAHFTMLCSEAQLRRLLSNGTASLQTKKSANIIYPTHTAQTTNVTGESRQLYQLVWKPLLPYLAGSSVVNYSPAGLLNYIAFNAISNSGKGVLLDAYRLQPLFSVRSLASPGRAAPLAKLSLWGNIDYNNSNDSSSDSLSSLPAASALPGAASSGAVKSAAFGNWPLIQREEVDGLKALFGNAGLSPLVEGKAASETLFKKTMNGFDGSVHLSTHGFYTPDSTAVVAGNTQNVFASSVNPMLRCGLVFSGANKAWLHRNDPRLKDDGILTGYEISQLNLSNVNLMTLSACETGLGKVVDYEGVFGLQRAFKMAGVNRLMMSLWEVPVKETAELMKLFYTAWRKGASPQEALRTAQRELRKKNTPYYWAGFVLME